MRAPWILRALLRRLAPPGDADALVGDLEDEARDIAAASGPAAARRWIWWQAVHSVRPLGTLRWHGALRLLGRGTRMALRGWSTDVAHVVRRLRRAPGFSAVAVTSLALGIGATSAIFSLAYAIWLKPLPYRAADELVVIYQRHPSAGTTAAVSGPEAVAYRTATHSFSGIATYGYGAQIARVNGERLRIVADMVASNLFDVLGAAPAVGRTFSPDDVHQHVAVLSHATWMARFGGDPAILSRTFTLSDTPYTIIGVMPAGFRFPQGLESEVWIPSDFAGRTERSSRQLQLVARLAPGVTHESAAEDVAAVAADLARGWPATSAGWTADIAPLDQRDGYRTSFGSLLGLVGLFQLVGCANLAGLLIARATERRGELAVQASLGASRFRLARQMLIEAGLLALAGGVAGTALAWTASRALAAVLPRGIAATADVQISVPVVAFTVAVSALTAVLSGVLPAFGVRAIPASEALTGARATGPRSQRLQTSLVVAEVAIAMVLLVGATLMAGSFSRLLDRDRGFDPHGMLALNVSLPFEQDRYLDPAVRAAAIDEILARVSRLPAVRHVGATNGFPGSALGVLGGAMLRSEDTASPRDIQGVLRSATPDYFVAMGVALRAGRFFTPADTAASPRVVIVNETLARAMWGGQPAVGRSLFLPAGDDPAARLPWTVVGVAADMHLGSRLPPDIFMPLAQRPAFWIDLVVRTDGDPAVLATPVRLALRALNPEFLIENATSIDAIISNSLGLERAQSVFAGVIAALAALVAGVGLYALLAFSVAQRTREFAIRLALGSAPGALTRWILMRGLRPALTGVAIGATATVGLVQGLRATIFGLDAAAPSSYAAAALVLLAVSVVSLWAPARRVRFADPAAVMRGE